MKVVILGSGRLGRRVALKLAKEEENSLVVIDRNIDALQSLGKDFKGKILQSDGANMETYIDVMKEKPDIFLALTNGDNTNIMAAEIAKQKYKVEKVLARVFDPIRAKAFEELGIEIFCPTTLSEKAIEKMLAGAEKEGGQNG